MNWSENVENPPILIESKNFDQNKKAYPFASNESDNVIHVTNSSVTFTGQCGPIKEHGINGCQIDDMITFTLRTIETFNEKFPCHENGMTIIYLREALRWLTNRKKNREKRGVEGLNKE